MSSRSRQVAYSDHIWGDQLNLKSRDEGKVPGPAEQSTRKSSNQPDIGCPSQKEMLKRDVELAPNPAV